MLKFRGVLLEMPLQLLGFDKLLFQFSDSCFSDGDLRYGTCIVVLVCSHK